MKVSKQICSRPAKFFFFNRSKKGLESVALCEDCKNAASPEIQKQIKDLVSSFPHPCVIEVE